MKYEDEFSRSGFLPDRTFLWNISISADTIEGALKALDELGKAIKRRRISIQIIEADYWLDLDKLNNPSPEWLEHLQRQTLTKANQNEDQP